MLLKHFTVRTTGISICTLLNPIIFIVYLLHVETMLGTRYLVMDMIDGTPVRESRKVYKQKGI